uniref:SLC41A/MgtE integral membrane domain-containing protein n=2 Tax=Pinguiococcus pyrenoidosus TaxID=172671 RepID=A0A7R9U878_9STRA|mmetsp:Transcript_18735/g.70883  ORF Transcript_18735/g.70883 Transcript_18735/m.70883 type:complete len:165 (+) Transcript_18735:340-834(+)
MVVQSLSGMILGSFEALIQDHVVITLFLTMLVGAGGNAGNQATVNIIRGLATGEVNNRTRWAILRNEANLGLVLGLLLSGVAFLRVAIWKGDLVSAFAIGAACLVIVSLSVLVGAALPLLFVHFGIDAAHAGPAIQVAMDIIGVTFTCIICSAIFAAFAPSSAA